MAAIILSSSSLRVLWGIFFDPFLLSSTPDIYLPNQKLSPSIPYPMEPGIYFMNFSLPFHHDSILLGAHLTSFDKIHNYTLILRSGEPKKTFWFTHLLLFLRLYLSSRHLFNLLCRLLMPLTEPCLRFSLTRLFQNTSSLRG